jgi:predicted RecA/RadA family phage recombinase
MAQQFQALYRGSLQSFPHTPTSAVDGGDVVVVGSTPLLAHHDIAANKQGELHSFANYDIVKENGVINAGAAVYWDADGNPQGGTAGTGCATTTSSGNTFLGYTTKAAGATDETVNVNAIPVISVSNTIHNPTSNAITDPGASGAIPVTDSGYCPLVSTGAQTRTLAAPTYAGQQLLLCMKTDGGDITLTCATGLNQTGNNTAVFNDAGDMLLLIAVYNGTNLRWRVVANDTVALSTV